MEISFHLCHLSQLEALTSTGSWQGQDNSATSWDCICLSGNMQGALLLPQRSQGWRCSREICPAYCPRDHESIFMGRSEDTQALCGVGAAQHAGHQQQSIPQHSLAPTHISKGFSLSTRVGSRLPPTQQSSFSSPWFLLSVWILERPAWEFASFELSVRGGAWAAVTQFLPFYSYATACRKTQPWLKQRKLRESNLPYFSLLRDTLSYQPCSGKVWTSSNSCL